MSPNAHVPRYFEDVEDADMYKLALSGPIDESGGIHIYIREKLRTCNKPQVDQKFEPTFFKDMRIARC